MKEMDQQVNRGATSPLQARRDWSGRNQSMVDGWFGQL
jgi:hypothetical protein